MTLSYQFNELNLSFERLRAVPLKLSIHRAVALHPCVSVVYSVPWSSSSFYLKPLTINSYAYPYNDQFQVIFNVGKMHILGIVNKFPDCVCKQIKTWQKIIKFRIRIQQCLTNKFWSPKRQESSKMCCHSNKGYPLRGTLKIVILR